MISNENIQSILALVEKCQYRRGPWIWDHEDNGPDFYGNTLCYAGNPYLELIRDCQFGEEGLTINSPEMQLMANSILLVPDLCHEILRLRHALGDLHIKIKS